MSKGGFPTTRWSLVLDVADPSDIRRRAALSTLCELYWYPVYAFIRRTGQPAEDARDLTQAFFTAVIEKDYFGQARPHRGRLRAFLLQSVRHFLANERDHALRQKRGGGRVVSLEIETGDERYRHESVDTETPEDVFEARWAAEVLVEARRRLEARHRDGWMRGSPYFAPLLEQETTGHDRSYRLLATELGATEGSLRVMAHRVRQQLIACLRDAIADTVGSPDEIDQELRYLQTVLQRRPGTVPPAVFGDVG